MILLHILKVSGFVYTNIIKFILRVSSDFYHHISFLLSLRISNREVAFHFSEFLSSRRNSFQIQIGLIKHIDMAKLSPVMSSDEMILEPSMCGPNPYPNFVLTSSYGTVNSLIWSK